MGEKKKKRGKIALYFLYGAVTVFILVMILSFNNISDIASVLGTADVGYVWLAIGLLLVYLALSPLTLCILAKSRKCKASMRKTYVIGMTEPFFNGITPFSTGGQPFQVYAFSRAKVKAAESTGLLLMNFIIMMIVTNAFAACSLFFYTRFVTTVSMGVIAIVGFSVNFLVLIFMIALATSRHLRNLLVRLVNLLCKIKFIGKFLTPRVPMLTEYFEQVQTAFKSLIKKQGTFWTCIAVRSVTMACYYAVTFFILRALHVDVGVDQLFFVICGTSFAINAVVFLPTPGSSGGIEFAFKMIFASIAGAATEAVAYGGMLMWRLMSYYLAMGISLLFYIGFEIQFNVSRRRTERAALLLPAAETEVSANETAEAVETEPEETPQAETAGEEIPADSENNTDNETVPETAEAEYTEDRTEANGRNAEDAETDEAPTEDKEGSE